MQFLDNYIPDITADLSISTVNDRFELKNGECFVITSMDKFYQPNTVSLWNRELREFMHMWWMRFEVVGTGISESKRIPNSVAGKFVALDTLQNYILRERWTIAWILVNSVDRVKFLKIGLWALALKKRVQDRVSDAISAAEEDIRKTRNGKKPSQPKASK